MKIALFTRYGPMGASSRVRTLQFLPWLAAHGVEVTTYPLLDDAYLKALYEQGRRPLRSLVTAYRRRLADLARTPDFDLAWVEKELLPWLPFRVEDRLLGKEIPVVADYDDAIFHQYDRSRWLPVRLTLGDKIDRVMQQARVVTAGNEYLAQRARSAGAKRVEVIPSVVPMGSYPDGPPPDPSPFVLGWIGTPMTARYLADVAPVLAELRKTHGVQLRLVGSGPVDLPGVEPEVRPWSLPDEGAEVSHFHAGIMPLRDGPWERGKCGYKIVQYMAAGRPVVASAVGAARNLVVEGETGFLVRGPGEWSRAVQFLVEHPEKARVMGERARALARERYSVEAVAPRLLRIFEEVMRAA